MLIAYRCAFTVAGPVSGAFVSLNEASACHTTYKRRLGFRCAFIWPCNNGGGQADHKGTRHMPRLRSARCFDASGATPLDGTGKGKLAAGWTWRESGPEYRQNAYLTSCGTPSDRHLRKVSTEHGLHTDPPGT